MNLVRGVDVSTWQHPGNAPIDWEKVRAAGISFALVKATQGDTYINPWLKRDVDDANFAGLLVGAYHFYEEGPDAVSQAEHFVGSLIGLTLDMGVWLDWEIAHSGAYVWAGMANPFLAKVDETRKGCGIYTTPDYRELLVTDNVKPGRWWLASWGANTAPAGSFIWQTGQEKVDGISVEVDADRLEQTRGVNLPSAPVTAKAAETPRVVSEAPESPSGPGAPPSPSQSPEAVEPTSEVSTAV